MSDENKSIVRRVIEEFFKTEDTDVADEVLAAGYVNRNPSNPKMRYRERQTVRRRVMRRLPRHPPRYRGGGSRRGHGGGSLDHASTPPGKIMGVLPIGNRVAVMGIGVYRFSGGKIVESWDEYDALGLLRQLGVNTKEEA
jgi:hypothetical protein